MKDLRVFTINFTAYYCVVQIIKFKKNTLPCVYIGQTDSRARAMACRGNTDGTVLYCTVLYWFVLYCTLYKSTIL